MQISEAAMRYETYSTKNIAELEKVDVKEEINEYMGEDFSYFYVSRNGEKYRMPKSVLGQIKSILEESQTFQYFKVKKKGTGINTSYMVIPLN